MPDAPTPDDDRTASRADELTPEERAAGSDDPVRQAAAVLADSDEREQTRRSASGDQEPRGPDGEQPQP